MKSVSNAYKALQKAIAGDFTARKDAINDTKLNAYWAEVAEAVQALGESIDADDAKPAKRTYEKATSKSEPEVSEASEIEAAD